MRWENTRLWSGQVVEVAEPVVAFTPDLPRPTLFADEGTMEDVVPIEVKHLALERIPTDRGDLRAGVSGDKLYVFDPGGIGRRYSRNLTQGSLAVSLAALALSGDHVDLVDVGANRSVEPATANAAAVMLLSACEQRAQLGYRCEGDEWTYDDWRQACDRVSGAIIREDWRAGQSRARIVALVPPRWFRVLKPNLLRVAHRQEPLPFGAPDGFEAQGRADVWVYSCRHAARPVLIPEGAFRLLRNQAAPGDPRDSAPSEIRILAYENPGLAKACLQVVSGSDKAQDGHCKPSFTLGDFRARRRAKNRTEGR